jgi:hypothetical protein
MIACQMDESAELCRGDPAPRLVMVHSSGEKGELQVVHDDAARRWEGASTGDATASEIEERVNCHSCVVGPMKRGCPFSGCRGALQGLASVRGPHGSAR